MSGDFEIIERRTDLPFRSRNLLVGYADFRLDGYAVFAHPRVGGLLSAAARSADPCETGGLLAGRVLRDAEGPYTLVLEAVVAPRDAGRPGQITLSPEMTTNLREAAASDYPTCDVVGWWHSHLTDIGYSAVDRDNQKMWTDPGHVGLLVFPHGVSRRALAYLGPDSRLMETIADKAFEPGQRRLDVAAQVAPTGLDPGHPEAIDTTVKLWQRDLRWRRIVVGIAVVSGLGLLSCLFVLAWLVGMVKDLKIRDQPAVIGACVLWNSDQYLCRSSLALENLEWWQDGKKIIPAREVYVKVPPGGSTWVELRLNDGGNSRYLDGRMLFSVGHGNPPPGPGTPGTPK